MKLKIRLIIMNFLQYAVWGAYLTSMGRYLAGAGMAENIGWFYAMQVQVWQRTLVGFMQCRVWSQSLCPHWQVSWPTVGCPHRRC